MTERTGTAIATCSKMLAVWGLLLIHGSGIAQPNFPSKPVVLVVASAPGGGPDFVARTIQQKVGEALGRPLVIDNRAGASGQIASAWVAKAAPDGQTLLLSADFHVISAIANRHLAYDIFRDFSPVTLLVRMPFVITVPSSLKATNLHEFIELTKLRPGKFNFASPGRDTLSALVMKYVFNGAGIELTQIPYKGGGPVVQSLLANDAHSAAIVYSGVRANIQAGKLKAIAVTAPKRMRELPDAPTVAESGYPGFEAYNWIPIFAPAGTPPQVIARLHESFVAALGNPEVQAKLTAAGMEPVGSTPEALTRFVKSEYERWDKFAREQHIQFEQL